MLAGSACRVNDTGASALGCTDRKHGFLSLLLESSMAVMCGKAFVMVFVRTAASPAGVTVAAS